MRSFLILFLLLPLYIFAQDSTVSVVVVDKTVYIRKPPLVKPKYPSYPLVAGFVLIKEAQKGDPFAQHELALRYLLGQGFVADTTKAAYWIKKAVEKKLTIAAFNYAIMLTNGIGVDWNPFEAYKQFKYAAESGMPNAQYVHSLFFTDNLVVNRNLNEALSWMKKAHNNGVKDAKEVIDQLIKSGAVDVNSDIPIADSTEIAEDYFAGQSLMTSDMELDYYNFEEDSLSEEEEVKMINDLLNQNTSQLKKVLRITEIVDSSEIKDTTGIELINYAARSGSPEAILIIGRSNEKGIGKDEDFVVAAASYIRAYRLGSYKSAEYLLKLIREPEFYKILKDEIDNGNPDAMFAWAGLIALGFDYQLDNEQAFDLLEKAVEKNHIPSIIETGLCYFSGSLVDEDKERAYEYWQKAADLGSTEGSVRLAFSRIKDDDYSEVEKKNFILDLERFSSSGSVLAQTALAYCYEEGLVLKQSKATAAKLYRGAAQRGNATAFNSLKRMYDEVRPEDEEFQLYLD